MKRTYYMIGDNDGSSYGGFESLEVAFRYFRRDSLAEKIIKITEEQITIFPVEWSKTDVNYKISVIDPIATGDNIKRLIKKSGIPIKELYHIFGFTTPQAIYKWQHGDAIPTVDNLVILADIFNVTIDEIIVRKEKSG